MKDQKTHDIFPFLWESNIGMTFAMDLCNPHLMHSLHNEFQVCRNPHPRCKADLASATGTLHVELVLCA